MKVVFLDIDGVLNHEIYYTNRFNDENKDDRPYPLSEFDPICVDRLNTITAQTNANIVISSSWRFKTGIKHILYEIGIDADIIGITDYVVTPTDDNYKHEIRGVEIQKYLDDHPEIDNYVILDDDTDMLDNQLHHFVNTSYWDGLTEECMDRAIKILNL